ncbi:putative monocarboxylate transporter 6 isoform X1 [Apostichopus japonicus]|uniref:Putative monocarboxylate transporter 6 isoform X1 n=1 Tax=Stichopus japonicus TaxID=307972 RepID=A0A2G8KVK6_STIJA|nr:putative monocarboxylate transporter 6 isoform X1 [Apostichopus japonicus]
MLKNKKGWITVACAFVLQGLTHGLGSSMGVFYIQWDKEFPSSSILISALASSVLATILCTAPISGAISRKAGIRLSMALGGALAFAGFCATSFVYRASLLFLTVTAMIGFGSSIVYMSSVIAVSEHFTKNFATASGVANAGASMGILVLPILFEILVSAYGWRGACLVVAAIELHVFVFMMIIKAPGGSRQGNKPLETIPEAGSGNGRDGGGEGIDAGAQRQGEDGEMGDNAMSYDKAWIDSETGNGDYQKRKGSMDASNGQELVIKKCKCGVAGKAKEDINMVSIEEAENGDGSPLAKTSANVHDENTIAVHEGTAMNGASSVVLQMTVTSGQASPAVIDGPPVEGNKRIPKEKMTSHRWFSGLGYILDLFNIRLLWTNAPFATFLVSFGLGGWLLGLIYDVSENYTYVFLLPAALGTVSAVTVLLNHMVWGIWYKRSNWPKRNRPQRKDDGSGENGADENGADGDGADGHVLMDMVLMDMVLMDMVLMDIVLMGWC